MTEIRVDPQILIAKADEMNAEKAKILQCIEDAKQIVASLPTNWEADESAAFQAKFKQLDTSFDNLSQIITEHIADLKVAADAYTQAIQRVKELTDSLPVETVTL